MQFSAERVAGTVLKVIGLGVGVGGRANVLEFRLGNRRFVSREITRGSTGFASTEEKDCDEGRENGQGEAAKFSVGQGRSPANLLTLIHNLASFFFPDIILSHRTQPH